MLCSRCKKRMAVVFITRMEGEKSLNEGICLVCAKEMGIAPVNNLLEKMGLSDEELDAVSNEMMTLMDQNENPFGDSFHEGGARSMPFEAFMKGELGGQGERQKEKAADKDSEKKEKHKFLDQYCQNLTQRAHEGKLDPVIGREDEIFRVMQILNRRQKNNPCLIGEPGVGKTAIAEGLALRIAAGAVPSRLADRQVFLLDLTALVAGTQFRGQFESRVKGLVDEVKKLGNIILVIDEVHNLVGTGEAEGTMNAANILKPALSRGEIQVIGATTFSEYRKHIEKDAALERRFQPIIVEEPSVEDSIEMLKGLRSYYEMFHLVLISDEIIRQAVELSERYITDRFLPDKAIDLMDEASSYRNLTSNHIARQRELELDLARVREGLENTLPDGSQEVYHRLADLKAKECRLEESIRQMKTHKTEVDVTFEDLAKVIELWTKIPAAKIKEQESVRLLELDKRLKSQIIGQDEAIDAVSAAIRRARVGISKKARPVSFIFVGPTGVGKTELVRKLAADLFDTPENLLRLDMSEFMEKHSVSRIIGSPPGYVGYDEAGQLTEKVRRKPYCVILFDEIEKAHPDVLNILLQILDDGKITDAHGRTVNFEHAVIVMTSNAGSHQRDGVPGFAERADASARDKSIKALNEFLRPEFINRVDEIVTFRSLDQEDFAKIASIMLEELKEGLIKKDIGFTYTDDALAYIVKKSFSRKYGARNLRRVIQKEIEDKLAARILETYDAKKLSFNISAPEENLIIISN